MQLQLNGSVSLGISTANVPFIRNFDLSSYDDGEVNLSIDHTTLYVRAASSGATISEVTALIRKFNTDLEIFQPTLAVIATWISNARMQKTTENVTRIESVRYHFHNIP